MLQVRASHMPMNFGDIEKSLGFSVGFDSMFERLFEVPHSLGNTSNQGYPPYNIRRIEKDDRYFIDMAVAGLSEDDLEVEVKESVLTIRSTKPEAPEDGPVGFLVTDTNYLHQGIAKRSFEKSFTLSDDIVVKGCGLINGLLTVELEKVIPEEKRARLIPIGKSKIKQVN